MKNWIFSIILFISLFSYSTVLLSQEKKGSIVVEADFVTDQKINDAILKGNAISKTRPSYIYGVEDAVVVVLTQKGDTLKYRTTDEKGFCTINDIPHGKYNISISCLGFLPVKIDVNHTSSNSKVYVKLEEGGFLLDEIKVKGNIPLVIAKGDTLIVNPKAVQTQQGAAAIEIIKQVPGIEINSSGTIMAFGEILRRTYVGGSTLFGRDVLSGLVNLDADLVKNIKFYDEDEIVSITNGVAYTRKIRVMNIETTRQLLSSTTGHLMAGAGKDIKEGNNDGAKFRYKAGGEINMFTTKLIVKGNALLNNVGLINSSSSQFTDLVSRRQAGEKELSKAGVSVEYNNREDNNLFKAGSTTRFSYNYSKDKALNEKLVERVYFPTDDYSDRYYSNLSNGTDLHTGHVINASYSTSFKDKKIRSVSLYNTTSFDNKENYSCSAQENNSDFSVTEISNETSTNVSDWKISQKGSISAKSGHSFNLNFSAGKSSGNKIQSYENKGDETIYKSSPKGENIAAAASARIQLYSKMYNPESRDKYYSVAWYLNMSTDYQRSTAKEYRYNVTDPSYMQLDSLSSYSYSNNHWKNSAEITMTTGSGTRNKIGSVNFAIGINKVDIKDDNRFLSEKSTKEYIVPSGKFSIDLLKKISLHYTLTPSIPSLEQIRTYVDDNNPLFVKVGNNNLSNALVHNLRVTLRNKDSFSANTNRLSIYFNYEYEKDAIVPYSVYYPNGGEIKELPGYILLPGATFTSYKNVANNIKGGVDLWYTTRINAIRTKFQFNVGSEFFKRPSYVQDKLNITDTYSGKFHFNTYTSYKWLTVEISSTSKYTDSKNTIKDNYKYFNQDLKGTAKITMFKSWYLNGSYIYALSKPVGGSVGYTNKNNILNMSTGVKLMKGRFTAGISVFDIFDKSTNFTTMLYEDYVQNTWTPTFGRYVSFDVLFNLRKYKHK